MQFFRDQVSSFSFTSDIFYLMASVCLLLIVAAIGLIDSGLVRRRNILDTWLQKLAAAVLAGGAFLIVGYGIWNWQFNQAFGIPNPLGEAIKSWWIGGTNMTTFSQNLDPRLSPEADTFQIFGLFFFAYAAVIGALLHSAGLERIKAAPMMIIAIVAGGIVMPVEAYLTWGSTSFLTNNGAHDYLGLFSCYVLAGVWGLIIAWRVKPRLGAFTPHPQAAGVFPGNLGFSALGVAIVLFAVPFLAVGCGYLVADAGYFGISMATSGFGIVALNVGAAYFGGIIGGLLITYKTKNPLFALIGPVTGYVGCAACLDVVHPWVCMLVALGSPFAFWFVYTLLYRARIDEKKIVPLGLGSGVYGAIVSGFVAWHTPTGGYFGLRGAYGFQHAQVSPWMQLAALGVTIGTAAISGLVLVLVLEKTIGLRVKQQDELVGLDEALWGTPPEPVEAILADYGTGVNARAGNGAPAGAGGVTVGTPD
jgi:Amt family ammonium transporter